MITAKNQLFRQQIRRRHIEEKFKQRRIQLMSKQMQKAMQQLDEPNESQKQIFEDFLSETTDIENAMHRQDLFIIYQRLENLNKIMKGASDSLIKYISQEKYRFLEIISDCLDQLGSVTQGDHDLRRIDPILYHSFSLLDCFIWSEQVTAQRILASKILQRLEALLMKVTTCQDKKLTVINQVIGISIKSCPKIAKRINHLKLHRFIIYYTNQAQPNMHDKLVQQFLFFLKSFLTELEEPPNMLPVEVEICGNAAAGFVRESMPMDFEDMGKREKLEDCLTILKRMLQLGMIRELQIDDLVLIMDFIPMKNCGHNIKVLSLLILDLCIYNDKADLTQYLVESCHLLPKIWGRPDQLTYIVINIISNIALEPALKEHLHPFLSQLVLILHFNGLMREIYVFLLNYLSTQSFQVKGVLEEKMVEELAKVEATNSEIEKIEANIWTGLAIYNDYMCIPFRIMNLDTQEGDYLRECLETKSSFEGRHII